jgi:hypothetical protein
MTTVDITDVRPNRNSFAEDRLDPPAGLWAAPPLAPDGEDSMRLAMGSEIETETRFGSRRKLIAGAAIIAVVGAAGLAYLFLASPGASPPGAKAPVETAESPAVAAQPAVPAQATPDESRAESTPETPVQPAPAGSEPSREASDAVPSPASPTAEAPPQVAPSAAAPSRDIVFLQRPGVNIRSAPSGTAPVLGTAPKGTEFTATGREGDWVQVESPRWKGWISSQFLAPNKPL